MTKPTDVPAVTLAGGGQLPVVGLGTWKLRGNSARSAVSAALAAGYRHIDTATMYGNEAEIGQAVEASPIGRDEVFLTTKLRPSDAGQAEKVLRRSLRMLRTERVDLWLLHWPPSRSPESRRAWNEMRRLRDAGMAQAIGVSNYSLAQLDDLIKATGEAPAVNQVHWDPLRHAPGVLAGHAERGVVMEGYSPIKDIRLDHRSLSEIAAAHQVTAAQVVLRWHLQHQIIVIPKSSHPDRLAANIDLFGFELTDAEMAAVDSLRSA
ncbi:MAG TPA: aldo/keto reductase [Streptosporangiaceae bacterium]|nr:aldo/keto reductase [Streptosporangiaceae bacterium]